MPKNGRQIRGQYWLATIPHYDYTPYLAPGVSWIAGQVELGEGGFLHWQLAVYFKLRVVLSTLHASLSGKGHYELARSAAIEEYVFKEDTAVLGTRFTLGSKPFKRGSARDWDAVYNQAIKGEFSDIEKSILVPYYSSIKRIYQDNLAPTDMERTVYVYWGATGTGKSRRAWQEAGMDAYPKDPRTKFWDGYRGQKHVVIDEFRGDIAIGHLLRWLDRYPVIVEVKGSSAVLSAQTLWLTSNLSPTQWYPDIDEETMSSLLRRIKVTHYNKVFGT